MKKRDQKPDPPPPKKSKFQKLTSFDLAISGVNVKEDILWK